MDNSSIPFPDEAAHLEDMNKKLEMQVIIFL